MIGNVCHYVREDPLWEEARIDIRAIRPDDKPRLLDAFRWLSPRSVYFCFLGPRGRLSDGELLSLAEADFAGRVTLVATVRDDGMERIVGVGRYILPDDRVTPHCAKVALAAADEQERQVIGALLLERLALIARADGITEFEAEVLGENPRMMRCLADRGFLIRRPVTATVSLSWPMWCSSGWGARQRTRGVVSRASSGEPRYPYR